MEMIGNETDSIGIKSAETASVGQTKQERDWLTYILAGFLVILCGGLIFGIGLPFLSLISAAPVTTNAVIVTPSGSTAASDGTGAAFQEINMTVDNGWSPNSFVVKTGVPVRWNVYVKQFGGCINGIQSSDLGIYYQFQKVGETKTFEFTPTKAGTIRFTCLMGMVSGQITVRDDVTVSDAAATNTAAANNPVKRSGGCGCGGGNSCGLK